MAMPPEFWDEHYRISVKPDEAVPTRHAVHFSPRREGAARFRILHVRGPGPDGDDPLALANGEPIVCSTDMLTPDPLPIADRDYKDEAVRRIRLHLATPPAD